MKTPRYVKKNTPAESKLRLMIICFFFVVASAVPAVVGFDVRYTFLRIKAAQSCLSAALPPGHNLLSSSVSQCSDKSSFILSVRDFFNAFHWQQDRTIEFH